MTAATAEAVREHPVPKIGLLSWLGLESVAWGAVIGHVIKWAVDCWYFIITQLQWGFTYAKAGDHINYWNLTDIWDHLPYWAGRLLSNIGIQASWVSWLMLKSTDAGWTEPRHLARGVLIGLVSGVLVQMLFAKPAQYTEDDVPAWQYVLALPKAILFAVPGCAAIGVLAYFLPWLLNHGLHVPGNGRIGMPTGVLTALVLTLVLAVTEKAGQLRRHRRSAVAVLAMTAAGCLAASVLYPWTTAYLGSVLANEINQWVAAGTWIGIVMGIAGSLFFAKYASRREAQEGQWFYAERSVAKLRSEAGLNRLRTRVLGTPSHRVRVHWLLDNSIVCASRSPWAARLLTSGLAFVIISAGGGAYIALAGPAAGH